MIFTGLQTKYLDLNTELNPEFTHLDYFPLVNARVHTVGDKI